MKYIFAFPEKCTGCRQCSNACSVKKFGESNPKRGAIQIARDEFKRFEVPFICMQCENPECVAACGKKALRKDGNIVRLDKEKCIGCRMCVIACPYGAISFFRGEIIKCDLCDGDPTCIKFCSTNAIVYGEDTSELAKRRLELAERVVKKH
jgi:Fe-S-cluster-containing hydrogenase component 2